MSFKGTIHNFLYKIMTKEQYLKFSYWWYHRKKLSFSNPISLSEKIYLLKVYNGVVHKKMIQDCYDKYKVREYIKNIIGDEYLTKLYGVWDNADKIDFQDLPEKCIFKISQSCGANLICKEGYKTNEYEIKAKLNKWLKEEKNCEYVKKDAKIESYCSTTDVVIICEELLEDPDGKIPDDIRFYCINGEVEFITVDYDTISPRGEKEKEYARNVYSPDGTFINARFGRPNDIRKNFEFLDSLENMKYIAEKLSKDFEFVRVDLYNIGGKIYFGELTWIPMGGAGRIEPDEFDLEMGEKLKVKNLVEVVKEDCKRGNK